MEKMLSKHKKNKFIQQYCDTVFLPKVIILSEFDMNDEWEALHSITVSWPLLRQDTYTRYIQKSQNTLKEITRCIKKSHKSSKKKIWQNDDLLSI